MKRRHVKFEAPIPPVKMYLDDLLQLEEIMTVGERKVIISHPKFEDIKNIMDLRDADGETLRELLIISYLDPGGRAWREEEIRLSMNRYGVSLNIDSSKLATI